MNSNDATRTCITCSDAGSVPVADVRVHLVALAVSLLNLLDAMETSVQSSVERCCADVQRLSVKGSNSQLVLNVADVASVPPSSKSLVNSASVCEMHGVC